MFCSSCSNGCFWINVCNEYEPLISDDFKRESDKFTVDESISGYMKPPHSEEVCLHFLFVGFPETLAGCSRKQETGLDRSLVCSSRLFTLFMNDFFLSCYHFKMLESISVT